MKRASFAAALAVVATLVLAPVASAIDKVDTQKLRKGVTLDGILEHERALYEIALANDGNRAAATPGYDASVAYVQQRLEAAGYDVTLNPFDFAQWTQNGPSALERVSPDPAVFAEDTDYVVAQFSAGGDVTAEVFVAGNTTVPPPGPGTGVSGCDPADFNGAAGKIALIQRGTCPFTQKYENADAAGAAAALIFNDGGEGREEPIATTAPTDMSVPAAMISNDIGEAIYTQAQSGPVTLHILVDATTTPVTQYNVIADTGGNPDRTTVVGAHLDSVEAGAGINDNGSGSAAILEVAEEMAERKEPRNRVRFAWWGAEESGLVGSTAYVEGLSNSELAQHEANLNFDMVGSPNFVRFIYDGDLSDSEPPPSGAPAGSAQIEHMFQRYFQRKGLVTDPTAFDGRSDYGPFIENGVPAGGLFTGAEGEKTEAQEARYGGFAGAQYDPCYHEFCDTFFNLDYTVLDQNSDAIAHAALTLGSSRSAITEEQDAAKKQTKGSKRGKHVKYWKFIGPFRVR